MATQAIEVQSKAVALIGEALLDTQDQLVTSLPSHLRNEASRFRSVLMELLLEPESELAKCSPGSIVKAAMEAAALGLFFTKHLGHAYLVPYAGKAEMQLGWRGLVFLAKQADPTITDIKPEIVYPGEQFEEILGLDPQLLHIPNQGERGNIAISSGGNLDGFTHAYAVARYKHDSHRPPTYVLMSFSDVQKCRNASKTSSQKTPWFTWTKQMVEKCPVRKLCLRLGLVPTITAAIARDEYRELAVDVVREEPRIQMPQRKSAALSTGTRQDAQGSVSGGQVAAEPDYSIDVPPLCKVCGALSELKSPGKSGNTTWGWKWRCATCPPKTRGCVTDAAEWHEKELKRIAALPASAPAADPPTRDPGADDDMAYQE